MAFAILNLGRNMRILKNIEIKNYRGLKHIHFPTNSINIIIGPNNTGKSSILEAIALLLTSDDNFQDIFIKKDLIPEATEDLIEYLIEYKEYYPEYLVRLNTKKSEIHGTIGRTKYSLLIKYYEEGIPSDDAGRDILNFIEKRLNKLKSTKSLLHWFAPPRITKMLKDINSLEEQIEVWLEDIKPKVVSILLEQPKLLFEVYKNGELHSRYAYFPEIYLDENKKEVEPILWSFWDVVRLVSRRGKPIKRKVIFETSKTVSPRHVLSIYDSLVRYGSVEEIKKFLLKRVQYLKGIDRTKDDLYVTLEYNDKPLPLSSMGEGFITLLCLSFLAGLAQKGVILWEEPEISLHPKFLEILGEEIVSYSDTTQFFISTHSLDLLTSILEKAEEQDKLSRVNVIRLHYRDDIKSVHAEVLSGAEAKEEIDEIGTDLRYT